MRRTLYSQRRSRWRSLPMPMRSPPSGGWRCKRSLLACLRGSAGVAGGPIPRSIQGFRARQRSSRPLLLAHARSSSHRARARARGGGGTRLPPGRETRVGPPSEPLPGWTSLVWAPARLNRWRFACSGPPVPCKKTARGLPSPRSRPPVRFGTRYALAVVGGLCTRSCSDCSRPGVRPRAFPLQI
jgi:hypothetical protein